MEEENVNQNVACLLKEIYERLKDISQKKGLNMGHAAKLLGDKNRMENLIMHVQYLLDNELYCDLILSDFMVRWKTIIDSDVMELTRIQ
jgi:hypothetical protein